MSVPFSTVLPIRKVAEQAKASKETIYSRFGDRDGLLATVIPRKAAATNAGLGAVLRAPLKRGR